MHIICQLFAYPSTAIPSLSPFYKYKYVLIGVIYSFCLFEDNNALTDFSICLTFCLSLVNCNMPAYAFLNLPASTAGMPMTCAPASVLFMIPDLA